MAFGLILTILQCISRFSMVDFKAMTKFDTVTGKEMEIRIACPLDTKGIAAAIAAADHNQKRQVSAAN